MKMKRTMNLLNIVKIAAIYKIVAILGTEIHRYIKYRSFKHRVKNDSMSRWNYYLEYKLMPKVGHTLKKMYGDNLKMLPQFPVRGNISDIPVKTKIFIYGSETDLLLGTIFVINEITIKKSVGSTYIDINIVNCSIKSKNKCDERNQNGCNMVETFERDIESITRLT